MTHPHDEVRRITDQLVTKKISRRDFVRRAGELGVSMPLISAILAACGVGPASSGSSTPSLAGSQPASGRQLVVASWGSSFGIAQRDVQFDPFTEETGIEIVLASQQPEMALIEQQVSSGRVEWDLAEHANTNAFTMANRDLLEKIDYASMDPAIVDGIDPAVRSDFSCGIFYIGLALGYNTSFFTADNHPRSWADFWDAGAFPAPRGLTTMDFDPPPLEVPLLAAGVSKDALYPLDLDAAFASLDVVKPNITKWLGFEVDGNQLLAQGELGVISAAVGNLINATREGQPVDIEWNEQLINYDAWVVPKGAPHKEDAMKFIEFCMRPDIQANFAAAYPGGPVVAAAWDSISQEVRDVSVSSPEHIENSVVVDAEWWTTVEDGKTNLERVFERWAEWFVS